VDVDSRFWNQVVISNFESCRKIMHKLFNISENLFLYFKTWLMLITPNTGLLYVQMKAYL
jgi:hypothetical protein